MSSYGLCEFMWVHVSSSGQMWAHISSCNVTKVHGVTSVRYLRILQRRKLVVTTILH